MHFSILILFLIAILFAVNMGGELAPLSLVTATLLLLASVIRGIPTSLVQINTAAIIGLGVSEVGWRKIFVHTAV